MKRNHLVHYTGISKYLILLLRIVIRTLFYSRKYLYTSTVKDINQLLNGRNKIGSISPSGRCALHQIFMLPESCRIVLPEYICNVVPMAVNKKEVYYYPVDAKYNINYSSIIQYITNHEKCCVVLPSYLNRECNMRETIKMIRNASENCIIVFDECQNFRSIMNLPLFDSNSYAVYSFNNKMTYGFMGGLIIKGNNSLTEFSSHYSSTIIDNMHGLFVTIKIGITDVIRAIKKEFVIPDEPEISLGNGIYSTDRKDCLKVSLAAASLVKKYWKWSYYCLQHNFKTAEDLDDRGQIKIVPGCNTRCMPYIPIECANNQEGILPLKGRYGGLPNNVSVRNQCFVLSNIMLLELDH